jgi:transcriptional regulator with XRE-family HTH domain
MNGEARSLQPEVAEELVRIGGEAYEWRRRAGLTQRAMEALTGIDQTTICKFEKGRLPGLRLHHVARIRLACKTGRRVDSTYGRRQPTRPLMTPDSSRTADDFDGRTGKSLEREGVNRSRRRQGQAEVPTEALQRGVARKLARGEARAASAGAPYDPSIGRANRAPRRR